jgi:probable F420-dependent oxidoreductase
VEAVKFGVCLPNYGTHLSKQGLIETSQEAERLGYDSIWTTDHILVPGKHADPYGNILDCLASLAYVGAVTERVQLGTSILVLPMRNPIVVAKQVATIDYLTNGRLILGTAVGWMEEEFQNLGISYRNRGRRFEEAIKLIRTLYVNETPKFQGRYNKFADAIFKPKPRAESGPTIWFGGNSEIALRRAANLADGWHPVGLPVDAYSSAARKLKTMFPSGKQFTLSLRILVDLEGKAKPYAGSGGDPRDVISGSQAMEIIQEYRDAGLEHLVCYFGDVELGMLTKKMGEFATDVIPSFRE